MINIVLGFPSYMLYLFNNNPYYCYLCTCDSFDRYLYFYFRFRFLDIMKTLLLIVRARYKSIFTIASKDITVYDTILEITFQKCSVQYINLLELTYGYIKIFLTIGSKGIIRPWQCIIVCTKRQASVGARRRIDLELSSTSTYSGAKYTGWSLRCVQQWIISSEKGFRCDMGNPLIPVCLEGSMLESTWRSKIVPEITIRRSFCNLR